MPGTMAHPGRQGALPALGRYSLRVRHQRPRDADHWQPACTGLRERHFAFIDLVEESREAVRSIPSNELTVVRQGADQVVRRYVPRRASVARHEQVPPLPDPTHRGQIALRKAIRDRLYVSIDSPDAQLAPRSTQSSGDLLTGEPASCERCHLTLARREPYLGLRHDGEGDGGCES